MNNQESSNQSFPDSVQPMLNQLPQVRFWDAINIYKWEGFWFDPILLKGGIVFKDTFQAQNDDVILASLRKTGTTWLKSLCLTIMQNHGSENYDENDVLVKNNPHLSVLTIPSKMDVTKHVHDIYTMPSPKLLHTHMPYVLLPNSVKNSDCKIVYITRNPKDTLVSSWHFYNTIFKPNQEPYPLEKAVESFIKGEQMYGPYYEHVLEYWLESQKRPKKILFLKYEELQKDPKSQVKKLALFLGKSFKNEEEVDKILWRCSLERLKNLDVNKNGSLFDIVPYGALFRRGVVGDWKNYLTPEMEERINQVTITKFQGSGLDFEL